MPRELFNLEQVLCQHVGLIFFIGSVRKLDPEPGQGSCWFLSIRDLAGLCSTSHIHKEVPHTNVYIARVLLAKSWAVGQKAHWFLSFPMLSSTLLPPGGHLPIANRVKTPVATANTQLYRKEKSHQPNR